MRFLLVVLMFAGCATDHVDMCDRLGCASEPGTLTLTVRDAQTQQPIIGQPTFTSEAHALPFTCSNSVDPRACPSWKLSQEGSYVIEVNAAGYAPTTIELTIEGPPGCCGVGPDTSADVVLTPL